MQPEELAKKYNFVTVGEDGVIEFFCDHTLLSSLRACEQYFVDTHLKRYRHKDRNWNLDFGQWLHATLELFYHYEYKKYQRVSNELNECARCGMAKEQHPVSIVSVRTGERKECESLVEWDSIPKGIFLAHGMMLWDKMEMDYYKDRHKMFKMLDGQLGALKLLTDYWNVYGEGKERLRVVGIEMPFGRDKEVPIVDNIREINSFNNDFDAARSAGVTEKDYPRLLWSSGPYRGYLTGRFDQIVDDGISLAAFDHKSTAFFDGGEASKFMPHDGMQGYVYALNCMVEKLYPGKLANKMLINHICLQDKSNEKDEPSRKRNVPTHYVPALRFTRSTLTYTPEQLEEYRKRNAATFDVLYQILVLERPAQWNTGSCNDMYHKECPFKSVHAITPTVREDIMNKQLIQVAEWEPYYESKAEII